MTLKSTITSLICDEHGLLMHSKSRYEILDLMGQGTFGQVVMCKTLRTGELVAIKVIKNHFSYHAQGEKEVAILRQVYGVTEFLATTPINTYSTASLKVVLTIRIDSCNYGTRFFLEVICVQSLSCYRSVYTKY